MYIFSSSAYKEEGVPILADCEYKQHKDDQLTEKLIPPTANLTTGTVSWLVTYMQCVLILYMYGNNVNIIEAIHLS